MPTDYKETHKKKPKQKGIKLRSKVNTYGQSDGSRITSDQLERKITSAKKKRMQMQFDEIGYNVCTDCERNDCKPVDASHDISVDECKKSGRAELAYDVNNITPRGRKCHRIYDKL